MLVKALCCVAIVARVFVYMCMWLWLCSQLSLTLGKLTHNTARRHGGNNEVANEIGSNKLRTAILLKSYERYETRAPGAQPIRIAKSRFHEAIKHLHTNATCYLQFHYVNQSAVLRCYCSARVRVYVHVSVVVVVLAVVVFLLAQNRMRSFV